MKRRPFRLRAAMAPTDARYKLWRSMRVLKSFTYQELCTTADAGVENARRYLRGLVRAGYVIRLNPNAGRKRVQVFSLVRDTGPHAPRISADWKIFDLNLEENGNGNDAGTKSPQS